MHDGFTELLGRGNEEQIFPSVQWKTKILFLRRKTNSVELPDDLKKFYLMSDGLEIRWSVITSTKSKDFFRTSIKRSLLIVFFCVFVFLGSLPIYVGKMFLNSLSDLAKIGANSRHIVLEELNDFADDGKFQTDFFVSPNKNVSLRCCRNSEIQLDIVENIRNGSMRWKWTCLSYLSSGSLFWRRKILRRFFSQCLTKKESNSSFELKRCTILILLRLDWRPANLVFRSIVAIL